jgi:two-component system, response regulator RpfG
MEKLTCESFSALDEEILTDFMACFREAVEEVELTIIALDQDKQNNELIHKLFRAIHSLKGNCRMVFLDPLVSSTHELEEIVQEIRNGLFPYDSVFGEFMRACIEQLEILVQDLIRDGESDPDRLRVINEVVGKVRSGNADQQAILAKQAITTIYDYAAGVSSGNTKTDILVVDSEIDNLKRLAERMVALKLYDKEKFRSMLELCLALNQDLGCPVESEQLRAAIYMRVVTKSLRHKDADGQPLPQTEDSYDAGIELLKGMPNWKTAHQIVEHRFENVDGSGPKNIKQADIHPGGRILRIVGHFTKVLANRGDSRFKKTLLRAVTDLNANVQIDYDQDYVEAFNLLVRRKYIANR